MRDHESRALRSVPDRRLAFSTPTIATSGAYANANSASPQQGPSQPRSSPQSRISMPECRADCKAALSMPRRSVLAGFTCTARETLSGARRHAAGHAARRPPLRGTPTGVTQRPTSRAEAMRHRPGASTRPQRWLLRCRPQRPLSPRAARGAPRQVVRVLEKHFAWSSYCPGGWLAIAAAMRRACLPATRIDPLSATRKPAK